MRITGLLGEAVVECTVGEFRELIKNQQTVQKPTEKEEEKDEEENPRKKDAIDAIKAAVAARKYTDRDIVIMHDEQGLEMKTISERTGIPYSSCWNRYHRATK